MLQINQNNNFQLYGRVMRDPQVYYNRDGSLKIAMTIAVEDETLRPDGGKSFQFIPIETFYGRSYVNLYGDSVKNSIRKGDVISARGRMEFHRWLKNGQTQTKLVMLCLDTPIVSEPAPNIPEDTPPFNLHDKLITPPTASTNPAATPTQPIPNAQQTNMPAPAAPVQAANTTMRLDPPQVQGPANTLPFVLHDAPAQAPVAAPVQAAVKAALPDPPQVQGPANTLPFVLHDWPTQTPVQAQPAAKATSPDPQQVQGPATTLPFILHDFPTQAVNPAPAQAAVPESTQLPGPATTLPFALHDKPADVEYADLPFYLSEPDDPVEKTSEPATDLTSQDNPDWTSAETESSSEPVSEQTSDSTLQDNTDSEPISDQTPDPISEPASDVISGQTEPILEPISGQTEPVSEPISDVISIQTEPTPEPTSESISKQTSKQTSEITPDETESVSESTTDPAPELTSNTSPDTTPDTQAIQPTATTPSNPNFNLDAPNAWVVQGHWRTMRSGKRVRVKPHVAHRRTVAAT